MSNRGMMAVRGSGHRSRLRPRSEATTAAFLSFRNHRGIRGRDSSPFQSWEYLWLDDGRRRFNSGGRISWGESHTPSVKAQSIDNRGQLWVMGLAIRTIPSKGSVSGGG